MFLFDFFILSFYDLEFLNIFEMSEFKGTNEIILMNKKMKKIEMTIDCI